ncbi:MAG: hypothetical protein K5657_07940 [Desulfovibrio sp.]|nr:hypothetical protein [Desulfovibrio sp.]
MINSIGSIDGYRTVLNENVNTTVEPKNIDSQPVNDTVSINSIGAMDEELESVFNNVMTDLAANQSDMASVHGGLDLERVKALLSL